MKLGELFKKIIWSVIIKNMAFHIIAHMVASTWSKTCTVLVSTETFSSAFCIFWNKKTFFFFLVFNEQLSKAISQVLHWQWQVWVDKWQDLQAYKFRHQSYFKIKNLTWKILWRSNLDFPLIHHQKISSICLFCFVF